MALHDASPLASYTERLLQVRRDFALYHDRVEVRASWLLGRTHCTTVLLGQLSPRTTEALIRNRWAKHSILIGSLAVATAVVLGRPGQEPWVQRASVLGWLVAGFCGVVLALTARKVRFVRVLRPDGKPGLDIAQAGPDAARFEEFLAALKRQVRQA
ncbi:MAG: hypothetical protein HY901_11630 [Deltaproteobacteria bacterium]|nr:hypothetical protein [Deltaproteobacteria bacterium]